MSSIPLRLFYDSKCLINGECDLVENYLNSKHVISEIMLNKNKMKTTQLNRLIDVIKQKHVKEIFISEDSLKCNNIVNELSCSSLMVVGSKMIIGKGANEK